uniref:SDR family NAD(P)-dependent oxidoreductase n=1 Tax=Phenylobacterium glaciei TaxID=2803784 RepID=A0A974SBA8_9CAUL|nr:SDR family NAD(P)-dependent oxidoreductase [Phenylobacterium glaciei]
MTPASKSVLILGATSDIGRAIAGRYAAAGWSLILTARDVANLDRDIADLAVRHQAKARALAFDVLDLAGFPALVAAVGDTPDTVVSVIGELGDQDRAMSDPAFAANVMRANFEGPSVILALFATAMAVRGPASSLVSARWLASAGERQTLSMARPRPASPPSSPACARASPPVAYTSSRSSLALSAPA